MADCSRGEIPDSIIMDKGNFHCKYFFKPPYGQSYPCNGYPPESDSVMASEDDILGTPNTNFTTNPNFNCSSSIALGAALGGVVNLKNVVYDDAYLSWESDVITVASAPAGLPAYRNYLPPSPLCNGRIVRAFYPGDGNPDNVKWVPIDGLPPDSCGGGLINVDVNSFTGISANTGWYGTSLQFYFNMYKVYCCSKDLNGNVVDYDYTWFFTEMIKRDGVLCLGSYGPIICFCEHLQQTDANGTFFNIQTNGILLSYKIRTKVEVF